MRFLIMLLRSVLNLVTLTNSLFKSTSFINIANIAE